MLIYESEIMIEAIHLILTGIGDEIYSTVDACQTSSRNVGMPSERIQLSQCSILQQLQQNGQDLSTSVISTTQVDNGQECYTISMLLLLKQLQDSVLSNTKTSQIICTNIKSFTSSHAATRYKGKEIAKPITPPSESASEEDSDPEQAQKDKDMQKNLALIAKYFKKLYKPTNNNLRTSSNTRNKNVDTTPRYKNDNQTGQFGNQRAINVVGARETVGSPVVQQSGIQCFNCKEFGHYAKEC
ncbi:zinc finger, CCHC-type, retrotransposon gag domain protein [Tanacetum coccineum]|uniref:Zinc finger, CCHC-type, retrotransposon gag domain protein n=1 Tax=Tanacetum coccineum TaxID=301880 RepID=A0ABQ5FV46_9ASTR